MTLSLYQLSVPAFERGLDNLAAILEKAQAHAAARRIEPAVLLQARLYPDMFPLVRQVQIATDVAKGCSSRLAGTEPPRYEDNETAFPELRARIERTLAHLKTFTPAQFDGAETSEITLKLRDRTLTLNGLDYLRYHALPNFHFHCVTAYGILRHNGVELGKQDFLGKF